MSDSKRMVASRVIRELQKRATTSASTTATSKTAREDTSGLTPVEVGLTLAVLLGVFLLLIFVGVLCKFFNKPRKEARPYVNGQAKLFQPSAAGYGTRVAGLKASEVNMNQGGGGGLLAGATPMGRGGRHGEVGDTSVGTPQSNHGGQDYFGKAGHSRGQSSGIKLPGATAASNRRGGPTHPPIQGNSFGPDGSGYTPTKPVVSPGPSGYASRPNGMGSEGMEINYQKGSALNVGLGPPPASDSRRKSKYTRADGRKVDSVGPGVLRKSMYLGPGADDSVTGTTQSNMRRVDSIGRGDHRRKSTYQGDGHNRNASMYNNGMNAQSDNFGAGRGGDPLGAKTSLSPTSKARQMRGPSPNAQQQQQQAGMPPFQRQASNGPMQGAPFGANFVGRPMQQQPMEGYPLPPVGYPGGGAPRMRPNQAQYAPIAGGYDRGTRQIV